VLGDAMAMPVGSMVDKFRPEFEAYIEEARRRNQATTGEVLETPLQVLQGAH
jgi:NADH-quinone oxidoreductase subunit F